MQRHPALRSLSSDHHSGLVLARKARQAANGDAHDQAHIWSKVVNRFEVELEPQHFRLEEEVLLPAMQLAGETALVERTLIEHAALRRPIADDQTENLARFADLLTAHIRFEEKELFERAQQLLDLDELTKLLNE
jgi:hemerythrin-like domain-containing protein